MLIFLKAYMFDKYKLTVLSQRLLYEGLTRHVFR